MFFHGIGDDAEQFPSYANTIHLRTRGLPWVARADPMIQRPDLARAQTEHFLTACFNAGHLPSPLPAASSAAKRLGYRVSLSSITMTTGALPTTMAAAAVGLIPWAVVATGDDRKGRAASSLHQKMLDTWALDTADADKRGIHTGERADSQPNPYGRQELRHAASFWLDLIDQRRVERPPDNDLSRIYALSAQGDDLLSVDARSKQYAATVAALQAATLLPRGDEEQPRVAVSKEALATPLKRTADWLHAKVRDIASDFVAADATPGTRPQCNVTAYLHSIVPRRTRAEYLPARTTEGLLSIYLQLPWLDALDLSATVRDLEKPDALGLRRLLQVLVTHDALVLAFQLLATPSVLPWIQKPVQPGLGAEGAEAEIQGLDGKYYQLIAQRFLNFARRRLPPFLLDALLAIREVVQTGAYGPIDFSHDFGMHATVPLMRRPVLELGVTNVHVRAGTIYLLLRGYLEHWRKEHERGSVHAQTRDNPLTQAALLNWARHDYARRPPNSSLPCAAEEAEAEERKRKREMNEIEKQMKNAELERALPQLLRLGVVTSVAATMGRITIGAAHYASVLTMCGLDLDTTQLVRYCVHQALRGGLSSNGTNQLVRFASRQAHPDTHLGLPKLGVGCALVAQHALRRLLLQFKVLDGLPPILAQWVQALRRAMATHGERTPKLDMALAGLRGYSDSEDQMLFLNAVHLKYALRGYMQQHGLFPSI